jgi:hypothetical protein
MEIPLETMFQEAYQVWRHESGGPVSREVTRLKPNVFRVRWTGKETPAADIFYEVRSFGIYCTGTDDARYSRREFGPTGLLELPKMAQPGTLITRDEHSLAGKLEVTALEAKADGVHCTTRAFSSEDASVLSWWQEGLCLIKQRYNTPYGSFSLELQPTA